MSHKQKCKLFGVQVKVDDVFGGFVSVKSVYCYICVCSRGIKPKNQSHLEFNKNVLIVFF